MRSHKGPMKGALLVLAVAIAANSLVLDGHQRTMAMAILHQYPPQSGGGQWLCPER
jgi:hypothetical protein